MKKSWTYWALEIAFWLAFFKPSLISIFSLGLLTPSLTVLMSHPWSAKYSWVVLSSFPLPGIYYLRASRQVRYFFMSPTTITFDMKGRVALISFSIRIGGIFSPPAVIISSFARPVMNRIPSAVKIPLSPEWRYPYSSIDFAVSSGFLKYPMKVFRPL